VGGKVYFILINLVYISQFCVRCSNITKHASILIHYALSDKDNLYKMSAVV